MVRAAGSTPARELHRIDRLLKNGDGLRLNLKIASNHQRFKVPVPLFQRAQ